MFTTISKLWVISQYYYITFKKEARSYIFSHMYAFSWESFHRLHQSAQVSVTLNFSKTLIREKEIIIFILKNNPLWKFQYSMWSVCLKEFLYLFSINPPFFFPINSFGPNWVRKTIGTLVPIWSLQFKSVPNIQSCSVQTIKRTNYRTEIT